MSLKIYVPAVLVPVTLEEILNETLLIVYPLGAARLTEPVLANTCSKVTAGVVDEVAAA